MRYKTTNRHAMARVLLAVGELSDCFVTGSGTHQSEAGLAVFDPIAWR